MVIDQTLATFANVTVPDFSSEDRNGHEELFGQPIQVRHLMTQGLNEDLGVVVHFELLEGVDQVVPALDGLEHQGLVVARFGQLVHDLLSSLRERLARLFRTRTELQQERSLESSESLAVEVAEVFAEVFVLLDVSACLMVNVEHVTPGYSLTEVMDVDGL